MSRKEKQMKCNIGNGVRRACGQEFDISNEEVIKTIEKIHKLEYIDTNFRYEDVEVALYNYDYYIRPGDNRTKFYQEQRKIIGKVQSGTYEVPSVLVRMAWAVETMELIKRSFDEEYFKEQVANRQKNSISESKDKLRTYLKKLNKDQTQAFMHTIITYRHSHGLFMSNSSSTAFWNEISDACRERGCDIPFALDSDEGRRFLEDNPNYYFDYLDNKSIATKLCEAIDLNATLATSAAKKLYKFGFDAMINYLDIKVGTKANV